jgi:polyhydroxybutyrate depolymerase
VDPRFRRRVGGPSGLVALALLTVACGQAHAAPAPPLPVAATAAPSRSCQRPATPGTATLTAGGRPARLHVPTGYRADRALPLVLNLHGTGSTAAQQEAASLFDRTADAHRFLVAYPQAARRTGTGFAWNIPGTPAWQAAGPDEAAYLRQLVALVSEQYCVDPRRVYGVGFSGGAREVSQLGCEAEPLFAAVAAVGGLRAPSPCPGAPVPVLGIHGSADAQNPYDGHGPAYWTYPVPEAARRWAGHDHCTGAPVRTTQPGAVRTAYRPCQGGTAVELYTLPGKGHGWPAGFPANEVIWTFFADHPQPRRDGRATPR